MKAGFTNFFLGMKCSELCGKQELSMHDFGKFLGECDYGRHQDRMPLFPDVLLARDDSLRLSIGMSPSPL